MVEHLGAELADATMAALGQTLPSIGQERVMCHRNLTDDHVLVDLETGLECGVIDFGDADPSPWWHDLVGIWMWGGDTALGASWSAYGRDLHDNERLLLESDAVTVAVWDVFHATQRRYAGQLVAEEVTILRQVLRY